MIRLFLSLYLILLGFILAYQFSEDSVESIWMLDSYMFDRMFDHVGTFHLLEEMHQEMDAAEFEEAIASYPAESLVPLAVIDFADLHPPVSDIRRGDYYIQAEQPNILYYRFIDSDRVVQVGPLADYEPLTNARGIYDKVLFAVLALSVSLWILMLHRKLKRLDSAATRLGTGDFSARVSELGKHRVGQLNHSFNLMAERLERLISGHKSLTNAVAHELRTPVSRIRFQLDMLYEETDDDQRNEYMYGMSDNINELTDLVDELLTYARFDREAPAIDMQFHSLHQSLINVVAAAEIDSNVRVHYDDLWMQVDPEQQLLPFEPKHLERAIGNLLSNAQKYSRSQVQISVQRTEHDCTIIVDDDGPGIPEEDRIEIFEPFRRLDNSRTRSTGGYGLGLAIVKQIAEWHGGSVRIENSSLGGARFSLVWPISVL